MSIDLINYRLNNNLNDIVLFSICGLSSVALCQTFDEDFNENFKNNTITVIMNHFNVNIKMRNACLALLNGDGEDQMEPYYKTLIKEKLEITQLVDILHELLVLFVSKGSYSSRIRYFLRHLSYGLHLNISHLQILEHNFVSLIDQNKEFQENIETVDRNRSRKIKRRLFIGVAAVGGGVLIGLTGGLAAPFIATGFGALGASIAGSVGTFVTGASAAIGSTAGVAIVGSLFGGAGAGLTGYKMKRRIGGLKEFKIEPLSTKKHLTLTIAISGYLSSEMSDFYKPWSSLNISPEQYYLVWESNYLMEMGKSFEYLFSYVKSAALTETLKFTILGALLSAIVWPSAILTISSVIDNPWSVCISRAELAGRTLADMLLSADYGKRPVTLIGFSLGARVIYYCLQELASRQSSGSEDIIEEAILIGAPVSSNTESWKRLERVVACRIINAYCRSDWVLKFLFRTATVSNKIAGLEPVQWINKRMFNMDLSNMVTGHGDYLHKLPEILQFIGVNSQPQCDKDPRNVLILSKDNDHS